MINRNIFILVHCDKLDIHLQIKAKNSPFIQFGFIFHE